MGGEELALLGAVCATPHDDTPRLVYADWLEENAGDPVECGTCEGYGRYRPPDAHGDRETCPACSGTGSVGDGRSERAEFIRVQCELAALTVYPGERYCGRANGLLDVRATDCAGTACRPCYLRRRERGLSAAIRRADEFRLVASIDDRLGAEPKDFCTRGFVDSLTLSAADWLAHADALVWADGATDECPGCGGRGGRYSYLPDDPTNRLMHGEAWYPCRNDGCRSGRVPRPCPATAQPITRVALTTWPPLESKLGHWFRLAGRGGWLRVAADESRITERLLEAEWPRVAFAGRVGVAATPPESSYQSFRTPPRTR